MPYYYHTRIPNIVFDKLLPQLTESELKVLLVILRQTLGWLNKRTGKSKEWDWISISFFAKKTGLSKRAIGYAIASLLKKEYIQIKNQYGVFIYSSLERKKASKLYYKVAFTHSFQFR